MKISVIVENTAISSEYACIHGLSLFIETLNHRLLFDLGPDETFIKNAAIAGVDLSTIDTVIISHGHYDHGGGLEAFLAINQTARIYIQRTAFDAFFVRGADDERYIGLKTHLKNHPQIILTEDHEVIDDELQLFAGVTERSYNSSINDVLYMEKDGVRVHDQFRHEQNLIITENGKRVLIAGCAHNGIVNILNKAVQICQCPVDHAIAGFHLHNPTTLVTENPELVHAIATDLAQRQTHYNTGHCTGSVAFSQLKQVLGNRLDTISAGKVIEIS